MTNLHLLYRSRTDDITSRRLTEEEEARTYQHRQQTTARADVYKAIDNNL